MGVLRGVNKVSLRGGAPVPPRRCVWKHDPAAAERAGIPDVFMNILTTNGLVGRYVTDRLGPAATLRKVAIRLGAPSHPGDTLVLTGTVVDVDADTAVIRVTGDNDLGRHVTGTVTVTLGTPV